MNQPGSSPYDAAAAGGVEHPAAEQPADERPTATDSRSDIELDGTDDSADGRPDRGVTQRPGSVRKVGGLLTNLFVRLVEIALILVGLGFVLVADDDELAYLAIWDLLAVSYVGVGVIALRRTRLRPPSGAPQIPKLDRFRFNFAFAIVASLIGFTVAVDIATTDGPEDYQILLNILGVIAMVMSWMLLQAGYARRYATIYRAGRGGLEFPKTQYPAPVDFLYFAVTIGTAFSVSDVLVVSSRMRWHVMVHSTIAFFYNAAVVAFALSMFAGR